MRIKKELREEEKHWLKTRKRGMEEGMMEEDARLINPDDYKDETLNREKILLLLNACRGGWVHDGNPERPHVELQEMCSNGYFDMSRILCYPNLSELLARQLAQKLKEIGVDRVGWVVGLPSSYWPVFSHEVARVFNAGHNFVDEYPDQFGGMEMVLHRPIPVGAIVLQVGEVVTGGKAFQAVRQIILATTKREERDKDGVRLFSVIGALVHRPEKLPADYGKLSVIALIEEEVWEVAQHKCPLCGIGSSRVNPKADWLKLIGKEV